jgi:hypothetical protein
VSIISPSWSAQNIIQALGRVHRANGRTPVRQRIVYCEGTVENRICHNLMEKIAHIGELNDGDLLSYQIPGLTDGDELQVHKMTAGEVRQNRIDTAKERCQRLVAELKSAQDYLSALERGEDVPEWFAGADGPGVR